MVYTAMMCACVVIKANDSSSFMCCCRQSVHVCVAVVGHYQTWLAHYSVLPLLSWNCTLISCVSLGASPLILQLFLLVASSFSPSDLDSTFNSHESGGSLWTTLLPPLVLASSSSSKDLPKRCFDVYTLYRKTRKHSAWPVVSPFLPQSMAWGTIHIQLWVGVVAKLMWQSCLLPFGPAITQE